MQKHQIQIDKIQYMYSTCIQITARSLMHVLFHFESIAWRFVNSKVACF